MERRETLFRLFTRGSAAMVALGAFLVLFGWQFGIPVFKSVLPRLVAMNPATAILFLLIAACLAITTVNSKSAKWLYLRFTLGGLILAGGIAVLFGFLLSWRTGIDRIVFAEALHGNRMAPNTAAYFVLVGIALVASELRGAGKNLSQTLALVILVGSFISILGYGYGATDLYGISNHIPMAFHTGLLLAVVSLGVLLSAGQQGFLGIFCGTETANVLIRRLLPTAIIVPCILGYLRVGGQRAGWYDTDFGAAIMVGTTVILLVTAILLTARVLKLKEAERVLGADALQEALLEFHSQTELLQSILNNMEDGVIVADDRGRFIQFNPAAQQILGLGPCDVGPGHWTQHYGFYLPDEVTPYPPERFPLSRALTGESVAEEEFVVRNATRSETAWLSISGRPLHDASGALQGGVIVFRDISARKKNDEAVRHYHEELESKVLERTDELTEVNQELLQKNRENEMFIYSVSHDLRSPLVNLQGFSKELDLVAKDLKTLLSSEEVPESIRNKATTLLDEDVSQSLHFIQTAVGRLGNIIDALLQLSRVGRVEYQWKPIDVQALVIRVIESMSSTLYDSGTEVQVRELPSCYGDVTALEQLFANLLGNAVKYCEASRDCNIEVGSIPPQDNDHSSSMRTYYVKDNGLGIPAAHQEKIFQAFKRVHPHVASGEGMGLAIVRRTVERHGGTAWVESQEGQGSTFFITLPLRAFERRASTRTTTGLQGETSNGSRTDGNPVSGGR